jgi:hypothetical protein
LELILSIVVIKVDLSRVTSSADLWLLPISLIDLLH